ncbi:MAG: N-acetylneuraminate synthase family protein [Pseudomonadota bacterium]|nr:N-acetylneuraminate synthase family protein [Pseudomonadota bacterium]
MTRPPEANRIFDDLYIFEMANNHQGSVEHGLRIIDAAADLARRFGVHAAVKLQFRDLDSFIHPDFKGRSDLPHIPRFESTRLDEPDFARLVDAIHEQSLVSVVTPFDEVSVDTCERLGVQILKVASCSASDWPLLTRIAHAQKPVIASTGGLGIYDIDNLVNFMRKRVSAFALLHCVSIYPTPREQLALNFMEKMIRRYPYVTVGYSGHESPDDSLVGAVAVGKGARLLERHFGVPTADIKLNGYSINPEQAAAWIEQSEAARAIGGDHEKTIGQAEQESLLSLKRGVYIKSGVSAGAPLNPDDVFFAMPCQEGQLDSGEFGRLRSRFVASRDYRAGDPVFETPQLDDVLWLRGILHDVRGQVYEAGLELGDDCTVEVSHHYGIDRFREVGCVLVNLVNREYCEKILIQLPGQRHPLHKHKLKEETFRLLWGDLTVTLGGQERVLAPGDKLLIERDTMHGFASQGGAIFSEVSTTSHPGDSYYADPEIAVLDPIQRKTIIDEW